MTLSPAAAALLGVGQRGELVPDGPGECPCGAPAAFGQIWVTEWYDRLGLVEDYVVTRLCADHRARKLGEN